MRPTLRLSSALLGFASSTLLAASASAELPEESVRAYEEPNAALEKSSSTTQDTPKDAQPSPDPEIDTPSQEPAYLGDLQPNVRDVLDEVHVQAVERPGPEAEVRLNDSGLRITSADKRYSFGLNAFARLAYEHTLDDPDDAYRNGFQLRNFRTTFRAGYNERVNLVMTLDVGSAYGARAYDAFVELKPHDLVRFRVGLQGGLVNIEQAQSATALLFIDRSMVSSLTPLRDVGAVVEVQPVESLLLELGVFNGVDDTQVFNGLQDDTLEFHARAQFTPRVGREPGRSFLRLGAAVTTGPTRGAVGQNRLTNNRSIGRRAYVNYAPDAFADGNRTRATGFFVTGHEGLLLQGEYIGTTTSLSNSTETGNLTQHAWHFAAAYSFGGLNAWSGVVPRKNVFEGGLGALQIQARVHQVLIRQGGGDFILRGGDVDDSTIATGVGLGAGWWWNPSVRLQAEYGWTKFVNPAATQPFGDEHLLLLSLTVAL